MRAICRSSLQMENEMKPTIDYITLKIPILRFKRAEKFPYPVADNVSVGSVVVTDSYLSIGLVAEVKDGKPTEIYSMYNRFHVPTWECPKIGGVNLLTWYDTGIKMSLQDWKFLSLSTNAMGFHEYWKARLKRRKT